MHLSDMLITQLICSSWGLLKKEGQVFLLTIIQVKSKAQRGEAVSPRSHSLLVRKLGLETVSLRGLRRLREPNPGIVGCVWWTATPLWHSSPKNRGPLACPSSLPLQGGLIALLLLLLVFTVALYAQRRWQKRRRIPQKSASTEATHEIHYIPSVLLGPPARESFRASRLQAHNSVIGVPIRETPILDDYDYEEEDDLPRRANHVSREDEFGSQVTHSLDSLGRPGEEKGDFEKKGESCCIPPSRGVILGSWGEAQELNGRRTQEVFSGISHF